MLFKLKARRNRLFGEWAANALGLAGREADDYVKSVIFAGCQALGDESVVTMVEQDLRAKSILRSRAELREMLYRFLEMTAIGDNGSACSDPLSPRRAIA